MVIALMLWIVIALTFVDNIIIMAAREMMVVMVVLPENGCKDNTNKQ